MHTTKFSQTTAPYYLQWPTPFSTHYPAPLGSDPEGAAVVVCGGWH